MANTGEYEPQTPVSWPALEERHVPKVFSRGAIVTSLATFDDNTLDGHPAVRSAEEIVKDTIRALRIESVAKHIITSKQIVEAEWWGY